MRDVCVLPGDSLVAISYNRDTIFVVDHVGRLTRTTTIPGYVWSDGCFPDGSVLVRVSDANRSKIAGNVSGALFIRIAFDGRTVGKAIALPEVLASRSTAPLNVVAMRDRIVVGDGSSAQFVEYSLDGRLLKTVQWAQRSVNGRFYGQIKADSRGQVWVEEPARDGGQRWLIFSDAGRLIAQVILPRFQNELVTIANIDSNFVILTRRGAAGISFSVHSINFRQDSDTKPKVNGPKGTEF